MFIISLVLVSTYLYNTSYCSNLSNDHNLTCVSLVHSGKHSLNKYLCQQIGINPCNTHLIDDKSINNTYLSIDKTVILDSPNPEICTKKLLSLLATLTCIKSTGIGFIGDNLTINSKTGETTVFISSSICIDIWEGELFYQLACSSRGSSEYAYLFKERESLRFCNNLTSVDSPVKLAQCDHNNMDCVYELVNISSGEIAEINWLLGGGIDYILLQSKFWALTIIATFVLLGFTMIILNGSIYRRRIKKKWKNDVVYFDRNLL